VLPIVHWPMLRYGATTHERFLFQVNRDIYNVKKCPRDAKSGRFSSADNVSPAGVISAIGFFV